MRIKEQLLKSYYLEKEVYDRTEQRRLVKKKKATKKKSNLFIKFDKGDVVEKEEYYNDYPYVDIYQTVENSDAPTFSVVYGPDCHWKRELIFPLGKATLYDREVYAPGNASAYLHMLYGPNWRDPPTPELKRKQGAYDKACKAEWRL